MKYIFIEQINFNKESNYYTDVIKLCLTRENISKIL